MGEGAASFTFPTRAEWAAELTTLRAQLANASNRFGFPCADGSVAPAATIYAWNEYGEGGIVAPTQGEAWMKLEVIKEIFGDK